MKKKPLYLQPAALDLAWNEPEENLRRVERIIKQRLDQSPDAPSEARLFIFPELTLTGFVTKNPQAFILNPPQAPVARLFEIAQKHRVGIAAGFPEANPADPKRPFNALILIDPEGKMVASYRKMHLFTVGKSPESSVYASGDAGVICDYRGWKVGLAICFDLRFPQLFIEYGRAGTEVILVPACWIGGPHKSYQFRTLGSAHAILAQAYVAAVNRSGKDPAYEYDGTEHVFSPFGERIYRNAPCGLDPSAVEECRKLEVRPSDRDRYIMRKLP